MFADHSVSLDMAYPAARSRFLRLVHGNWLDGMSRNAYAEGLTGQLKVGPLGGVPGMSKLVRVSLLDPVLRDHMVLVPFRWEATGPMGRLFPVLDANLVLGSDDEGQAVLRITGVYRPPLDGLGEELDRLMLHRVAAATLTSLLRVIAGRLGPGTNGAAGQGPPRPEHPDRDVPPDQP